ncbi:DUF3306 domain-containing protein [Bosea lathyri]|uniref:DUF3306 domain-containing protein n=1 Tax=Bosea lathyri TaxID=1036778 RepID=A0A1H5VJW5_9HYPH|nr:DUF3306 domain-containing protein [Bosea lathyri]SEF87544.1 Protein of unknown function [Bosea lathyri]
MSADEGGEGFLARWSRRKRDPEKAAAPVAAPVAEPALPEGRTLEDLIAELPRLEDLVPGQSLQAFMQSWVPTDIRTAALRRMWLLDPAIRDYVNPALDYAYDYNIPGGAPGYGPMETSAEMVREVTDMFERVVAGERGEPIKPIAQPNMAQAEEGEAATEAAVASADLPLAKLPENEPLPLADRIGEGGQGKKMDASEHSEPPSPRATRSEMAPNPRRHGGALPG